MLKKLFILIYIFSTASYSQHSVSGNMSQKNEAYTWMALYQLKGAKQIYVDNVSFENDKFFIVFPDNSPSGMYRLRYKMDNKSTLDILYNKENIELTFNPETPLETVDYLASKENNLYHDYVLKTNNIKQNLDITQYSFFKMTDEKEKSEAHKTYQNVLLYYHQIQEDFEEKSRGMLANHFIKSNEKYYAPKLFESPQEYLNSEKKHFFEYVNFTDEVIINSNVISQAVLDYVFYLNTSEDIEVQQLLYKNAIDTVLSKVADNDQLKSEVINTLLFAFAQNQNITIVDYLQETYYNKLPNIFKTDDELNNILTSLKLAVGRIAPDFTLETNGKSSSLHNLNTAKNYVLVFWSTSCSHCITEIPKLYEYMQNKTDIQVINIGLENDPTEYEKYDKKFDTWISVLGLGKWESAISKNYNIVSTPTYFILNEDKIIIEKPEHFKDVKNYLDKK